MVSSADGKVILSVENGDILIFHIDLTSSSCSDSCFRQTKFASFQRQLNLYGFRRITQGRDKGGYYHELFLRGRSLLALKMQRTKVKGTGARKASSPETEPNFYAMPFVFDDSKPRRKAPPAVAPVASPSATMPTPAAAVVASPLGSTSPSSSRRLDNLLAGISKVSPPSYATAPKPISDSVARAAILRLNSPSSLEGRPLLPTSRLALALPESRLDVMSQMMASSARLERLREANRLSLTHSALQQQPSSFLGESSLLPASTQRGPLHLNALNMPCTCAVPAF